jgi:hypothetical protein
MPNGIEKIECIFEYNDELRIRHEKEWKEFVIKTFIEAMELNTFGLKDMLDKEYYQIIRLKTKNERYLKI